MYKAQVNGLNQLAKAIYADNRKKGFWDKPRNVGELLMLVVSELGKGLEAHRKGRFSDLEAYTDMTKGNFLSSVGISDFEQQQKALFDTHVKDTFEDEIADAIIRLLDMSGGLGIDIERHIAYKLDYNRTRAQRHGKKY